jgi:hypothetical protein
MSPLIPEYNQLFFLLAKSKVVIKNNVIKIMKYVEISLTSIYKSCELETAKYKEN